MFKGGDVIPEVSYSECSVNGFKEESLNWAANIGVSAAFPDGTVRDRVFVYCFNAVSNLVK